MFGDKRRSRPPSPAWTAAFVLCTGCTSVFNFFADENATTPSPAGGHGGAEPLDLGPLPMGGTGPGGTTSPPPESAQVRLAINTEEPCPDDLSFTDDLKEMVFDSNNFTLLTSKRDTLLSPWSVGTPIAEVTVAGRDTGAEISRDGLTLWWSSSRPGGMSGFGLWSTTRATRDSAWEPATQHQPVPLDEEQAHPTLSDDGLLLIYNSRSENGDRDLLAVERETLTAAWGVPRDLTQINSTSDDQGAHLSADGLSLYFGSNREGGAGGSDLYVARRGDRTDDFTVPQPLTEFNTPLNDGDPWVSSDGSVFVFSRNNMGTECETLLVAR